MCSVVDLPIPKRYCCQNIFAPIKNKIHKLNENKYFIDDIYQGDIVEVVNGNVKVQLINGSIVELCFKLLDEANNQAQCDKIESNSNEQK